MFSLLTIQNEENIRSNKLHFQSFSPSNFPLLPIHNDQNIWSNQYHFLSLSLFLLCIQFSSSHHTNFIFYLCDQTNDHFPSSCLDHKYEFFFSKQFSRSNGWCIWWSFWSIFWANLWEIYQSSSRINKERKEKKNLYRKKSRRRAYSFVEWLFQWYSHVSRKFVLTTF